MMDYLISNIGTIVVFLIIAAVVTLIVIKLRKDKAGGKSSCGSNCGCCPNSSLCRSGQKNKELNK